MDGYDRYIKSVGNEIQRDIDRIERRQAKELIERLREEGDEWESIAEAVWYHYPEVAEEVLNEEGD